MRANTFSASSYSNEWSNIMAKLKSSLTSLQEMSKATEPYCFIGGPQDITSPRLRSMSLINEASGAIELFFVSQAARQKAITTDVKRSFVLIAKNLMWIA